MRALLGAPFSRDRGAVPRQAHNLKVARAIRAPASNLAVVTGKGYFSPVDSDDPEGLTPLVARSRHQFGSGVDHSYFASLARGRRFDSCLAPDWGAGSSVVERLTYCDRLFPARAVFDLAVAKSPVTSGQSRFESYTASRL